jgi:HK97 family phage portal protein
VGFLTDIRQALETRRISSTILTATGPVRDVLHNYPDGWEVEQPWLWRTPQGINGPFTIGNPIPGSFEGSNLASIPAVARCTAIIVDSLAGMPWKVYRGREQLATPDWIADPQALRLDGRVLDPAAVPDVRLSHVDFWSNWLTDALWWGDGLVLASNRDSAGAPKPPMWLIHPFDWQFRNGAYFVGERMLPATDVIHLRGPGPITDGRGMGAFQRFAAELGYTLTIKDYAHSVYFAGVPSGYLKVNKDGLTQEKADELSSKWDAKHGNGNRRVAVLNATTDFQPLTWSPVDAALKEAAQANLNEISNAFGVPGYFIGASDPSNTYANLETRRQDLVMFTLLPWTSRIEAVLDAQFPRGVELKVTVDALLRGTTKDRYEAHKLAIEAGWKLPEEVRATEDLPPIETVPTPEVTA